MNSNFVPGLQASTLAQNTGFRRGRRSPFYVLTALFILLVVLLGFEHTLFLRFWFANKPLSPLAWAHGIIFVLWVVILITQSTLVLAGKLRWHRRIGWFAALYALGMAALGTAVLVAVEHRHDPASPHANASLRFFLPFLGDMVLFAGFVAAGILWRRAPETHKRMMVLATISLLDAAYGRFPILFPALGGLSVGWMAYGPTDLTAAGIALLDWRRQGRLHPAYAICVPLMIAWHAGLLAAGGTAPVLSAERWLLY